MSDTEFRIEVDRSAFESSVAVAAVVDGVVSSRARLLTVEAADCDFLDAVVTLLEAVADKATEESLASGDVSRLIMPLADLATFMQEHPLRYVVVRSRKTSAIPSGQNYEGQGQVLSDS